MAKTESTAVNALIELVQTGNAAQPDGAEELFATPPRSRVSAPRMTGTVPPSAAEVASLPRRVPQGTQQVPASPVRLTTAPPARAASIPPISTLPQPEPDDSMIKTTPSLGPTVQDALTNPKATLLGAGSAQLDRSQLPPLPPPNNPKATLLGAGSAQIDRSQLPPLPAPTGTMPPVGTSTIMGHASAIDPALAPPPRAPLPPPRPSRPSAELSSQRPSVPPPMPAIRPSAPPAPVPVPVAMAYPSAKPYLQHLAPDMTSNQAWFDEAAVDAIEVEHDIGTAQITKQSSWKVILPKLIMPMVILVIVGIFVGGYFAFDGDGGQKTTKVVAPKQEPAVAPAVVKDETKGEPAVAVAAKEEPAPATAEVKPEPEVKAKTEQAVTPPNLVGTTTEPAKTAAVGAFVDVKIESEPSKATVMIVDRGKTSFLGPTPIVASLDPSREYDIVFTYPNKPTQLEHIAPAKLNHLKVKLGKSGNQAKAEKPKTEVKVARKIEKPKTEVKVEKPKAAKAEKKAEIVDAFETKAPPPAPAGDGVLMISSKPPCEIFVDGVPTGLTTPQRAIKLAAGKHKITLVNTAEKIKKTIAVEIIADQPTKVIQDLMAK